MGRVVVKFGGACLADADSIEHGARFVSQLPFEEKIVVVSAMGSATNELLRFARINENAEERDVAEILSMGERTSARIFCSALKKSGIDSVFFDPEHENWPVITHGSHLLSEVDMEKTRELVRKYVEPLLSTTVPVVCGFLGKTEGGEITTLGRGGSDTTAALLANCLEADEILLVKETDGIMSADPKFVEEASTIGELDIHEVFALAHGGAKVIHREALRYKLPGQRLKVVSFHDARSGTMIKGEFDDRRALCKIFDSVTGMTIVGRKDASLLKSAFSSFEGAEILGIGTGRMSFSVFFKSENVTDILRKLNRNEGVKAVAHREGLGMMEITHPDFVDVPGSVLKITEPLARSGINIVEVTTSKATINVILESKDLEKARVEIEKAIPLFVEE